MSEPPRWTIRRTPAILAASLLLVVVAGVPAWAGSSIAPAEVPADADQGLTLTVTEPEDEAYGDTTRVTVAAPTGFTVLACGSVPVGWECTVAEDGTGVTFVRTSPVSLGAASHDFGFSVHTPVVNGQYAFRVTQADGPPNEEDPPVTVASRPAVTVTGGQDPPSPTPSPSPTPPADDGGSQDDGETTGGSGSQADDPTGEDGSEDGGAGSDAGGDDTSSTDSSSAGSTAPRRTQGRASGSTLEIIPGESTDDPDIAPPDVADDPAIAPPGDTDDDAAAVAATGAQPSEEPDGPPWQQVVGAAMLLVGGAVVAIRRWGVAGRLRGLEPLELLRRWRGG